MRKPFISALLIAAGTACLTGCSSATLKNDLHKAERSYHSYRDSRSSDGNSASSAGASAGHALGGTAAADGQLSLITEPAQGMGVFDKAISTAHKSVLLVMYELEDPAIEADLAAAEKRGVQVRVLLGGGYYGEGSYQNQAAYSYLKAHGVPVRWTPKRFALTHQKTMVIDGRIAYIMTLNFTSQYYSTSRDFAIADRQPADIKAITATFDADWADRTVTPPDGADLVWSPGALSAQLKLIGAAKRSVDIYNEEMNDSQVTDALAADARRGVDVRVVMTAASEWDSAFAQLTQAGAHVRTYKNSSNTLYIHAKMILVDGRQAVLESENFSWTSLERNRELGIAFSAKPLIASLQRTFAADYRGATPFRG